MFSFIRVFSRKMFVPNKTYLPRRGSLHCSARNILKGEHACIDALTDKTSLCDLLACTFRDVFIEQGHDHCTSWSFICATVPCAHPIPHNPTVQLGWIVGESWRIHCHLCLSYERMRITWMVDRVVPFSIPFRFSFFILPCCLAYQPPFSVPTVWFSQIFWLSHLPFRLDLSMFWPHLLSF